MADMIDDESAVLNLFKAKLEEAMKLVPNLPSMDPSGMQMWLNAIQSENEVQFKLSTTDNGSIQITLIQPSDAPSHDSDQGIGLLPETADHDEKKLPGFVPQPLVKSKTSFQDARTAKQGQSTRTDNEWGFFHRDDGQVIAQSLHRRLLANQKEVPVETGVSDTHKDLKQVSPTSGTRSNLADDDHASTDDAEQRIIVSITTDASSDAMPAEEIPAGDVAERNSCEQSTKLTRFPCVRSEWYVKPPRDLNEDLVDDVCDVDTSAVAGDLRDYLKSMSVSLESFAQTQLQRSQGTLSDLLNHPKPWKGLSGRGRASYRKMMEFLSSQNLTAATKKLQNPAVRRGPASCRLPSDILDPISRGVMPSDALIASQASELELEAGYLRAHCEEQVVHQRAASESRKIDNYDFKSEICETRRNKDKHICPKPGCGVVLGCKAALKTHMKTHTGLRPYKCSICSQGFISLWNCQVHEKKHAAAEPKTSKRALAAAAAREISHAQDDCDTSGLDAHDSSSEKVKTKLKFLCGSCAESFSSKHLLRAHVKSSHSDVTLREIDHFECGVCKKNLRSASALAAHMRTHTGDTPYGCRHCARRFRVKANALRHAKTHTGERPYKCPTCAARFAEASSVLAHMRRHTGERPFKCQICGRGFTQRGPRDAHEMIHSDRRPFLCATCGRSFRQKSNLRAHELRHRGVRRYSCDVCSRSFSLKNDLHRHVLKHKRIRPHSCQMCPETFVRLHAMRQHLQKVHNICSYKCKACGRSFRTHTLLARHIASCRGVCKSMDAGDDSETEEASASDSAVLKVVTMESLMGDESLPGNKAFIVTAVPRAETFPNPILDPLSPSVHDETIIDRSPSISRAMATDIDPSLSSSHVSTAFPLGARDPGPVHVAIMTSPGLVFHNAETIGPAFMDPVPAEVIEAHAAADEHRLPVIAKIELPSDANDAPGRTATTASGDDPNMQSVIVAGDESDVTGTRFVVVSVSGDVGSAGNSGE